MLVDKCDSDDGKSVFRFSNGMLQRYVNPFIASSWDPDWNNTSYTPTISCDGIPFGPNMVYNAVEGKSYKCDGSDDSKSVFRFSNGMLHRYVNPSIASSWDPDWNSTYTPTISCDGIPFGPNMVYNATEGKSYKCVNRY